MTISASIPAAVISMAILRGLLRRGTLRENNMVQTIGSAGESLAAGMIFTIPALFIMGFEPRYLEIVVWGAIGGLLGVLFMIPLRRVLIVREHGKLPFPEGVACAEVLRSGDRGGFGARAVFTGLGVGAVFELFRGLGFWAEYAKQRIPLLRTEASLSAEPALLGVGYILGVRIAALMLGGAVLGWFVIIPAIGAFGAGATAPVYPETVKLIRDMSPGEMWTSYLRYIGAGAVVLGGIVSLIRGFGTVGKSLLHFTGGRARAASADDARADRDLPLPLLFLGIVAVFLAMWFLPAVRVSHFGAIAVIVFAFLFVSVSARLVGLIGSSSNPASGMTIATLLGASLIGVYVFNMTAQDDKFTILSVGALVCMAICIAGDTSQDLKTGFLLRATPWKQQIGELIGVLTATAVVAFVIIQLNNTYGFDKTTNPDALLAPQANIMRLVVDGVVGGQLPWELVLAGAAAALVVELLGVPSLPFAVGLYLPLYLSTPIMVGGLARLLVARVRRRRRDATAEGPGVLPASGLVAGQGVMGLALAGASALIAWAWASPHWEPPERQLPAPVVQTVDHRSSPAPNAVAAIVAELQGAEMPATAPALTAADPTAPPDVAPPDPAVGEKRGPLVHAGHFFAWLTTVVPGLEVDYGLKPVPVDAEGPFAAFAGDYAFDPYYLLPLLPFALLTFWLILAALRRPPPDDAGPGIDDVANDPLPAGAASLREGAQGGLTAGAPGAHD